MKAFTPKQLDLFLLTKVHLENADSTESSYYSSQLRSCFLPKSQPDGCNFDLKVQDFYVEKWLKAYQVQLGLPIPWLLKAWSNFWILGL